MDSKFNCSQCDALQKVKALLDEHFEGWALVVTTELDDQTENHGTSWHGGLCLAKGLLQSGLEDLAHIQNQSRQG